jgi:hypothetical protein
MLITMERKLDEATTDDFLVLYREAFAPLAEKAAARQSLTDDEFREEMTEESVLKFVAWDDARGAVALAFVATDLSVIPWISVPYFAARFPEEYARGALYYFGALLVRSDRRGGTASMQLLKELTRFVSMNRGIAAFDCCQYNEETIGLPELVAAGGRQVCEIDTRPLDSQRYFAYIPAELPEGYSRELLPSLQTIEPEGAVIDLVALERQEAERDARTARDPADSR